MKLKRNLQKLKVDLLLKFPKIKKGSGVYQERDIIKEIRRIRKELWNEKYSKAT
jgi:hypothetical protein